LIAGGVLGLAAMALGGPARSGFDDDPTYGLHSTRNVTIPGMPIPVVFGRHLMAPPIVSALSRSEGGKQVLYMLLLIGEGEIDSVSDIQLNDVPLTSFADSYRIVKRGTPTQSSSWLAGGGDDGVGGDRVVTGFNTIGTPYSVGKKIEQTGSPPVSGSHVHEMRADADEVWFELAWPGGLAHRNNDGTTKSSTWYGAVQYKKVGEADSKYVEYLVPKNAQGKRVMGDWTEGKYGNWATTANTTAQIIRVLPVVLPAKGRYVVRIQGHSRDDENDTRTPTVLTVTEVRNDARAYVNRALVAIRVPLSEQMQGIPKVTCVVKGLKLLDFRTGSTAWSDNPVLAAYWLLTNARGGLGGWLTSADIDAGVGGTWRAAADRCEGSVTPPNGQNEKRYRIGLVMTTKASAREWLDQILAPCLMTCFSSDGLLKVREDRDGAATNDSRFDDRVATAATEPPHRITADDDGKSTLVVQELPEAELVTVVRIRHTDEARGYQEQTTTVKDKRVNIGAISSGPIAAGSLVKGGTSGGYAYVTLTVANGVAYLSYVQASDQAALVSGETLTVVGGSASCTTTSAPYDPTPERPLDLLMPGVVTRTQAQRVGRYLLTSAWARRRVITFGVKIGNLHVEPLDIAEVSSDRPPWTAKKFVVQALTYDEVGRGTVEAREYSTDPFVLVDPVPDSKSPVGPSGSVQPGIREAAPTSGTTKAAATTTAATSPTAPKSTTSPSTGGSGTSGWFGGTFSWSFLKK
jgi:hypothetical protein